MKIFLLFSVLFLSVSCNFIWRSPSYYTLSKKQNFDVEIMSLDEYSSVGAHARPYIYSLKTAAKGQVYILGVEHTKDSKDKQLETMQEIWVEARPSVALVESRLGFLFGWFQDPVKRFGENGLTAKLAKNNGVELFTWEPTRDDEIIIMLEKFSAEQLALFYSLRPYFGNMRHGKPTNPEDKMQDYIESRTDYNGIRNIITSWQQIDKIWKRDFPSLKDWRDMTDQWGWPKGYLSEIANYSNTVRDIHLCSIIVELVNNGFTVYASMGSGHAVRIEKTLHDALK